MIVEYSYNMEALTKALGSRGNAEHFLTELSDAVREEILEDDFLEDHTNE